MKERVKASFDDILYQLYELNINIDQTHLDVQSQGLLKNASELIKYVRNDFLNKAVAEEYSQDRDQERFFEDIHGYDPLSEL